MLFLYKILSIVVLYDDATGNSITLTIPMDSIQQASHFRVDKLGSAIFSPMTFSVNKLECLCISGKSGAGKSLLLRAIADLDEHDGSAWLQGTEAKQFTPSQWRRNVSYMPAESAWWYDTVGEHFSEDLSEAASKLGFPADVMKWKVARLSSGEKQRLALLRAMQFKPGMLLLDEPTANMDEENTHKVEALVLEYINNNEAAVIWVSHSQEQIERIANQHIVLQRVRQHEPD